MCMLLHACDSRITMAIFFADKLYHFHSIILVPILLSFFALGPFYLLFRSRSHNHFSSTSSLQKPFNFVPLLLIVK